MAALEVVRTIDHAVLSTVKFSDIVEFELKYDAYLTGLREVSKARDSDIQVEAVGYRACIESLLLVALFRGQVLDETQHIDNLTNDHVAKWIDQRVVTKPTDIPSRVRSALRDMYYEYDASDAELLCLAFFYEGMHKIEGQLLRVRNGKKCGTNSEATVS